VRDRHSTPWSRRQHGRWEPLESRTLFSGGQADLSFSGDGRVVTAIGQTAFVNDIATTPAGEIVATDNGDPTSFESFQAPERKAFNGLALVIVRALLWVETESQKGIVIGSGGRMIKAIGTAARRELERELGSRVHLDLSVRVRRSWRADDALLDRLGIT